MSGVLDSVTEGLNITKYSDWLIFTQRLEDLVRTGRIRKIVPLASRHFAEGDEWFLDPATGEIYVHGVPNAPLLPSWDKFNIAVHTQVPEPHSNNLSVIPVGAMGSMETRSLKVILTLLIREGRVEPLDPNPVTSEKVKEMWFKDKQTEAVYRLVERGGEDNHWERVPESELRQGIQ